MGLKKRFHLKKVPFIRGSTYRYSTVALKTLIANSSFLVGGMFVRTYLLLKNGDEKDR